MHFFDGLVHYFQNNWHDLIWSAILLAGAIVLSLIIRAVVFWALRRFTLRHGKVIIHSLVTHGAGPTRWIFPLLACLIVLPGLPLPHTVMMVFEHTVGIFFIAACAWLVILFVQITADVLSGRYRVDVADNLTARRIQTQFQMLHRVVVILVIAVAVAICLMTFHSIQHFGDSILASAGVASLVVGLAMKGTLSNLVAGIQIAFSQPFRIGDVVVIEGNWGWIEEIGTMYVVVRVWNLVRLVVPLSWFLENSFQNWTRTHADLLEYVYIYADYTVPVDELRAELRRLLEASPDWLGKVCALQVTNADERGVQLRALADAADSSKGWDLQCYMLEGLIKFLQQNYPQSLPRTRIELPQSSFLQKPGEPGPSMDPGRGKQGQQPAPLPGDPLRPAA